MKMSWAIQKNKRSTRAKALQSAWAILQNEDVTVLYLMRRLNHHKTLPAKALGQFSLFTR